MVNELVNACVIGADVGFGKLPHPAGGGVDGGVTTRLFEREEGPPACGRLSSIAMGLRVPNGLKKNTVRVA